jgi:hypothetical protein
MKRQYYNGCHRKRMRCFCLNTADSGQRPLSINNISLFHKGKYLLTRWATIKFQGISYTMQFCRYVSRDSFGHQKSISCLAGWAPQKLQLLFIRSDRAFWRSELERLPYLLALVFIYCGRTAALVKLISQECRDRHYLSQYRNILRW